LADIARSGRIAAGEFGGIAELSQGLGWAWNDPAIRRY
jgi:hypothetical protein